MRGHTDRHDDAAHAGRGTEVRLPRLAARAGEGGVDFGHVGGDFVCRSVEGCASSIGNNRRSVKIAQLELAYRVWAEERRQDAAHRPPMPTEKG
jgi:hypothetical protein